MITMYEYSSSIIRKPDESGMNCPDKQRCRALPGSVVVV
jgi:hypothetical protein